MELLDDRTVPIAGGHRGLSLGRSLPGAIAGTVLVAASPSGPRSAPAAHSDRRSDREKRGHRPPPMAANGATGTDSQPGDGADGYVDELKDGAGDGE